MQFVRDGKPSTRGIKAWLCAEMGWTEQQYNEQRFDFINDLVELKEAQGRAREDEERRALNTPKKYGIK